MNIILKKLQMQNFKGIKDLTIDFSDKVTNIYGENATGKTTTFDAFCWVLFGKDSHNNSKFNIRPIDTNGKDIDYIDISVILTLLVDGKETSIKKVQKQKWVKKRGSENPTFEGNINEYEWNGFPKSEADFNSSIAEIITDVVFMIVTNPSYFPNMKWKEQREALMKLVSEINDNDVIGSVTKFIPLADLLQENSIDAWKEKYAKALKEYNKQIDAIPNRIDEVNRNIQVVDYSVEEVKLNELKSLLAAVEEQIEDTSKGYEEIIKLKQDIFNIKSQMKDIENQARREHDNVLSELKTHKNKLDNEFNRLFIKDTDIKRDIASFKSQIERNLKEVEATRLQFKEVDSEELGEDDKYCPTCRQVLTEEKIVSILEDFKNSKTIRLQAIREKGIAINKSIEEAKQHIVRLESELGEIVEKKTTLVGQINLAKKQIDEYPAFELINLSKWVDLGAQCKELEFKLSNLDNSNDLVTSLKTRKNEIQVEIDAVKKILNGKEVTENAKRRVEELKTEQKELAQKVADTEKMLFLFDEFIKTKMNMLSDAINSKFKIVSWKLFDTQINGGLKETCELTVNGVPYTALNSAAKVQAGLDIINTMSAIYNVSAPIFIDNREGVNNIPEISAQVINLIVSKDKKLRVENI